MPEIWVRKQISMQFIKIGCKLFGVSYIQKTQNEEFGATQLANQHLTTLVKKGGIACFVNEVMF